MGSKFKRLEKKAWEMNGQKGFTYYLVLDLNGVEFKIKIQNLVDSEKSILDLCDDAVLVEE